MLPRAATCAAACCHMCCHMWPVAVVSSNLTLRSGRGRFVLPSVAAVLAYQLRRQWWACFTDDQTVLADAERIWPWCPLSYTLFCVCSNVCTVRYPMPYCKVRPSSDLPPPRPCVRSCARVCLFLVVDGIFCVLGGVLRALGLQVRLTTKRRGGIEHTHEYDRHAGRSLLFLARALSQPQVISRKGQPLLFTPPSNT